MSEKSIALNTQQTLKLAGYNNAEFATMLMDDIVEQIDSAIAVITDELDLKHKPTIRATAGGFEVDLVVEDNQGGDVAPEISRILKQDMDPVRRQAVLELADRMHEREGECEIDPDARISEGDDNGAYVQAWIWVPFHDTELDKEKDDD